MIFVEGFSVRTFLLDVSSVCFRAVRKNISRAIVRTKMERKNFSYHLRAAGKNFCAIRFSAADVVRSTADADFSPRMVDATCFL